MDFEPSKISLEKIPFWDRHRKTPINTSKFQHVIWIVQNTNQHVWILVHRLDSTSRDTTIALGNFILNAPIIQSYNHLHQHFGLLLLLALPQHYANFTHAVAHQQ